MATKKKPVPAAATKTKKPATPKAPPMGTVVKQIAFWVVVLIILVGFGIWVWTKIPSTKPGDRSLDQNKAFEGEVILAVPLGMEKKVQVGSYIRGREDGYEMKGIRHVTLGDLERIADEAINEYRDPNLRKQQEQEEDQQQNAPPQSAAPGVSAPPSPQAQQQRPAGVAQPQGPAAAPATQRPAAPPAGAAAPKK